MTTEFVGVVDYLKHSDFLPRNIFHIGCGHYL